MNLNDFKQSLFFTLQPYDKNNQKGRWFDWLLIILIVANVIAVMLETMPEVGTRYHLEFLAFEIFSVGVFTIEYIARIWTCTLEEDYEPIKTGETASHYRLRFLYRPMSLIDLMAILPFYLGMIFAIDLRVLRLFRLVRMIKLGRYSIAMQTLQMVIAREYRVIIAALGMLMIVMVIAATTMYHLERYAQPEHFGSIPQALWWSVVTLSTVGYGDVSPITALGQFVAGLFILIGVALFALPAGILASSFTEQMSLRRDKFRAQVINMLHNGHLQLTDIDRLENLRRSLQLDREEAQALFASIRAQTKISQPQSLSHCPHCKKPLLEGETHQHKPD
ncbi:ion transporter [Alteromonas facilis]|uniref:ion transporter n=1 Tax=Alteromonas facilis TaxID=2048004 RepID=UPI000C28BE8B|nr:ion transporter [Alteromonas facilis]